MIYQSLPTIRAWHNPLVTPIFVILAIGTGGLLAILLLRIFGFAPSTLSQVTALFLCLAAALKSLYWSRIDTAAKAYTVGSATGLGRFGDVRPLDPPHTQANFVMREMGYQIARKHAQKLRWIVLALGCLVPALLLVLSLVATGPLATLMAGLAVVAGAIGVFTERWLFFAEAQHVVTLYYGAKVA